MQPKHPEAFKDQVTCIMAVLSELYVPSVEDATNLTASTWMSSADTYINFERYF